MEGMVEVWIGLGGGNKMVEGVLLGAKLSSV